MDSLKNPFSPGAGTPPPELAGRDSVLKDAYTILGRTLHCRSEKSMVLTGLRGVGKTVLLNEIERMAMTMGIRTVLTEAHEGKNIGVLLSPHLRKTLFDLDRISGTCEKVRRGMAVLRSFLGAVKLKVSEFEISMDIQPEKGTADSGDIEIDLPELFVAVGEAAKEKKTAVSVMIDEVQYFDRKELGALIMAVHRVMQRQLPLSFIGAGLPVLPALAGESKSYAERLFLFPEIGPLTPDDTVRALRDPVQKEGVDFTDESLEKLVAITRCYPYFIQEWGYQTWNRASESPISADVVESASEDVISCLDTNFFRVRFDRLTPSEKNYLRAMAVAGTTTVRSADIAATLGCRIGSLGPVRAKLINKGMIYSPVHGETAFTVPLFDEFMRRAIPSYP